MKRSVGRALAVSTLQGLNVFGKVYVSEPETFGGYDPVAVVHSKSLGITQDARGDFESTAEIYVSIYVRRPRDASETEKDAVEDAIDDLSRVAQRALYDAFYDAALNITIAPSETGYPNRPLDSATYRIERFAVRFNDDEET